MASGLGEGDLGGMPLGEAGFIYFSASLEGTGTVDASIGRKTVFSASLDGTGAASAILGRERPFSATLSGSGVLDDVRSIREILFGSTLSGVGTMDDVVFIREMLFSPSFTGTGVVNCGIVLDKSFSSSLNGTGTLDAAAIEFRDWRIDGRSVWPLIDEVRNWQELTLSFRATASQHDDLDGLDSSAGQFEIIERRDGSYVVIDRAGADSEVTLTPPAHRKPLRVQTDYHIEEYDETIADQEMETYEIELNFVADEPKDSGDHGSVSADDDEWLFEFADGGVATSRIEREVGRGGSSVGGRRVLRLVLTTEEATVVEESLNRQAAASVREVPDAQNLASDSNPDDRNTISVTTPSDRDPDEQVIDGGDYVVSEWETTMINDVRAQVELHVLPV